MAKVIGVRFSPDGKIYSFDPGDLTPEKDSWVVVETSRGDDCGQVAATVHNEVPARLKKPLRPVKRLADSIDIRRMEQNRKDEARAFTICEERIPRHKLDMKLIRVEYAFDRSKIVFFFTADGRVDFRELVKDLAGTFHTRIELRQVGVRDESKMLGGLGICGQPLCCSRFLTDFQPVSIKMAKEQGLSLNPAKISGTCGRLMCCLAYEQDAYEYLNAITPSQGAVVNTPDGPGVVLDAMVAAGKVRVRLDRAENQLRVFKVPEVEYVRGGKSKRPPIPMAPDPVFMTEEDELPPADYGFISPGAQIAEAVEVFAETERPFGDGEEGPASPGERAADPAPDAPARNRPQNQNPRNRRSRPQSQKPAQGPVNDPAPRPEGSTDPGQATAPGQQQPANRKGRRRWRPRPGTKTAGPKQG